jgi:hypothetical protein
VHLNPNLNTSGRERRIRAVHAYDDLFSESELPDTEHQFGRQSHQSRRRAFQPYSLCHDDILNGLNVKLVFLLTWCEYGSRMNVKARVSNNQLMSKVDLWMEGLMEGFPKGGLAIWTVAFYCPPRGNNIRPFGIRASCYSECFSCSKRRTSFRGMYRPAGGANISQLVNFMTPLKLGKIPSSVNQESPFFNVTIWSFGFTRPSRSCMRNTTSRAWNRFT